MNNTHAQGAVRNKLYKRDLWGDISFPVVKHLEDYVVGGKLFNETNVIQFLRTRITITHAIPLL